MFSIRIDASLSHEVIAQLTQKATCYALSQETTQEGKNMHLHMYVETPVCEQTLRNRIRKLGFAGNKSYSLKNAVDSPEDKIKCVAYVLKEVHWFSPATQVDEALQIPQVFGCSRDFLKEVFLYDTSVKVDLASKKSVNVYKSLVELVESRFSSEQLASIGSQFDVVIDKVGKVILDYMVDNDIMVRRFQFQAYLDSIACKHSQIYRSNMIQNSLLRKN